MSHYFYNNVFDYVSPDGNFGYYIEKDYMNYSTNQLVTNEYPISEYIVEIHYLGDVATTFKMQVENIDTTIIEQVEYVPKVISSVFAESPEGMFYIDGTADTTGLSNWSGQQAAFNPHFGIIEVEVPLLTPITDIDGNERDHGYLYMESSMYYDVIGTDPVANTSLNELLYDAKTFSEFIVDLDGAVSNLNPSVTAMGMEGTITDARNGASVTSMGPMNMVMINQVPDMLYFDNIDYYDLNGDHQSYSGTFSQQIDNGYYMYVPQESGYSSTPPSEFSLIGEFRITDFDGMTSNPWEFDANFQFSMNNEYISDPGIANIITPPDGPVYDISTTISKDAMGNISFSSDQVAEQDDDVSPVDDVVSLVEPQIMVINFDVNGDGVTETIPVSVVTTLTLGEHLAVHLVTNGVSEILPLVHADGAVLIPSDISYLESGSPSPMANAKVMQLVSGTEGQADAVYGPGSLAYYMVVNNSIPDTLVTENEVENPNDPIVNHLFDMPVFLWF
jgi:hypothetical protein